MTAEDKAETTCNQNCNQGRNCDCVKPAPDSTTIYAASGLHLAAPGSITFSLIHPYPKPVLVIHADGRIVWNEVEIFSQEEFRAAMIEVHRALTATFFTR